MLLLSSQGQLLAERPCMPPTCQPQTAWVKFQRSPNMVHHTELSLEATSSPKGDFHPFKNFFCLSRRSLMTTENHSGAKLSSHLEKESKPERNIYHWVEVRGGGGEVRQPVLIWLGCVSLQQKQTPCWNFPTQLSSTSYKRCQMAEKFSELQFPLQESLMMRVKNTVNHCKPTARPRPQRAEKESHVTYITRQSLDHMWQVCFSAYEVAHEKTAIFINMPIFSSLLFGGMWDLINSSPIQNRTCIGSAKSYVLNFQGSPIPLYKGNNWLRKYLLELCTNT